MIKVRMVPHVDDLKSGESGIHEVIRKWFRHLPKYDIDLVPKIIDSFDILAVHAGMANRFSNDVNIAAHLHGLYWTADYPALAWEWMANANVIDSLRHAKGITVPSNWVAETIQRDMRVNPTVIPHGVDWDEWQHDYPPDDYVLAYAKNRVMDVCNPAFITRLAGHFPDKTFLCTFAPKDSPSNVRTMGVIPHDKMKQVIQRASLVISPIKETFGVLTLESMASGTPILGYDYGGNRDLIQHGVNGYLARVGDFDDLISGMEYCIKHRNVLSANAKVISKSYTWDLACKKLSLFYKDIMSYSSHNISIVIPTYNYAHKLSDAINSALHQSHMASEIIVVDDGSNDNTEEVVKNIKKDNPYTDIIYHKQDNSGVAVARNRGIEMSKGDYIVCLDADDRIDKEFLRACVEALDNDPTLGIAYTGLLTVEPNGNQSISPWPPQYNFDDMVYERGINQVPTCCMFRKEMWKRLGGYRSRYCPNGAGSEDAEFWLRAGLYGFPAKKVTDAGLFIYSYKSGRVSGDKEYREIDWRSLHPSTKDKQHPFICVATPDNKKPSHPVRQYDEPIISVIIPVGKGHKNQIFNALDSLESQNFRKWEVIVVDDYPKETEWSFDGISDMINAYPYVRLYKTEGNKGSGYARNMGARYARGSLLLFLDADDNLLVNDALEIMLEAWNATGMGIYTDYVSKSFINEEEANRLKNNRRLIDYNPKNGLVMYRSQAEDYDCERAIKQPENPLYIWNLITTLIPKAWHDEIDGFDENMPSWEDWEYWLRMARSGKCFYRLSTPMVAYRFYTGNRRELGIQMPQELLSYISNKLEGVNIMPCHSCGGNKRSTPPQIARPQEESKNLAMNDADMVLITYENPNRGQHKVIGFYTKLYYGYRQGGGTERFYVHKDDVAARPDWFVPYQQPVQRAEIVPPKPQEIAPPEFIETQPAQTPIAPQQDIFKPFDLETIPGITEHIKSQLEERNIKSWEDIVEMGVDGLKELDGIGDKRANAIYESAKSKL